ncbi:3-oxoacyl-ACP reductase [Alsobacter metallidurans]|uniref:3-oxoacyl-ACP reductase n=1 Tax=Alsobacter metallidurans TaxID=340221 RepID=A0A917I4D3_9HYPH|nr:SDR family NAD(P)-dependent oxidoreductase [Alsobacter metallidurans]GGH07280.1 3-oxoacyl-ACP reductase [Alsobacter metallidurans]
MNAPAADPIRAAFGLDGRHALVTGGGSGLGLAIARCFLQAGARVTIVGVNEAKLAAACAELGGDVAGHAFDVTRVNDAEGFAAGVRDARGSVDILVNNAGSTVKKPIDQMTPAEFQSVLDVHVSGAFALTRALLPQIEAGRGSVLFTASMSSFLGIPNVAGYSAAKAAHVGMIRALATELAPRGVRVNGVAPGWIDTPLFRGATANDPARRAKIDARIPMGRLGQPEDIGWAMTYLASAAANYVTGHITVVDGGALHAF